MGTGGLRSVWQQGAGKMELLLQSRLYLGKTTPDIYGPLTAPTSPGPNLIKVSRKTSHHLQGLGSGRGYEVKTQQASRFPNLCAA